MSARASLPPPPHLRPETLLLTPLRTPRSFARPPIRRFIREVCQKLNEPKHNLMARVLEQTGKIFILDLMAQVEAVEDKGGQFVADGTRRRTRGGVFLNLLKAQVTKEQWDKIFEEEKEAQKRRKAMKRRLRYNGEAAREGEKTPTQASPLPLSYKCVLQS